jgi:hypothetical protein
LAALAVILMLFDEHCAVLPTTVEALNLQSPGREMMRSLTPSSSSHSSIAYSVRASSSQAEGW